MGKSATLPRRSEGRHTAWRDPERHPREPQALEAVLRAVREAGAASWWCLGDLVGYGADPSDCLRTAIGQAERCLAGNHDLGAAGKVPLEMFAPWAAAALVWTRDAIGPVGRANLERLGPQDPDGAVPVYHPSPRGPVWEYVTEVAQARAALEHRRVPLTLIGYTHVPFAWRLTIDGALESVGVPADGRLALDDGRWLVNPGSVGQPRDEDARAAWALCGVPVSPRPLRAPP